MSQVQRHLSHFFAHELAQNIARDVKSKKDHLLALRRTVDEGYDILTGTGSLTPFGDLLHKAWLHKRELTPGITNRTIDRIYREGREAGALGGKLLGAGGGGFVLFFVPPDSRESVRNQLSYLTEIPIATNAPGSRIIHA